ncbi:alpha-N-acetylglucosaminidase TIM-barrel domain-containing protein [Arthrobacter glacialis]|uniref:Glycosyl hydrolase family 98 putative carbohydrate-binding module domain-containing protein n=1 Tax=Arthrobacter glacialis TaxID=1664 RepID=A0A2S3ZY61_ARTGL|nr:alpha-N-acetylglucosaminidase TIM-barrel domain-containing protein [Arthrobacter glacialis]POH74225.1 hypothetical protein CVS27_06580 [Arthrobacter glacialis]
MKTSRFSWRNLVGFGAATAVVAVSASLLGPISPAGAVPTAPLAAQIGAGAEPAATVLDKLVGADAGKFDLKIIAKNAGQDTYKVTAAGGRVTIEGSTPATILAGFNAYVGQVLHQSTSWNSNSLKLPATLPGTALIQNTANVQHRFVNNDVEDGYTGAYRSLQQWKDMIDTFALHGLNEVFMPVGAEAVYLDVLKQFGYSEAEVLAWIPQSAHQPWWLLQNMSADPHPITLNTVNQRAALGKDIANYIRSLGMVPVLPGYFGTVPAGFKAKNPTASVVPQGNWVGGYQRPDWLDPNNVVFPQIAKAFYDASTARLGASSMYKMDLLHEGGIAGTVNVSTATVAVEKALQTAHMDAIWVLLGWQNNPPQAVAAAANPATTFIVDGISDRYNNQNRDATWKGIPYAFGTIWNFGGHTTMGSQLSVQNTRYFEWLNKPGSAMKGLAIMPEGGDNNPAAFDFFAGLAWRSAPTDLTAWFSDFAQRRYGVADANAAAAWDVLRQTAYDLPANDGWSEAADGLFGAAPSLTVNKAAAWSPGSQRYNMDTFATALPKLLAASPAVKATDTYKYDLMDVSRQVLSNLSRTMLPKIKKAYDAGEVAEFEELTTLWLESMDLMDKIAGTNSQQLLGSWIKQARDFTTIAADKAGMEADQRSLVSLWSPGMSNLNDYANREWNGLVGGYYKARWSAYFTSLEQKMTGSGPGTAPNFAALGAAFINGTGPYEPAGGYPTTATGDMVALATDAVVRYNEVINFIPALPVLPAPPGNGKTQLSELPFVSNESDASLGPIGRNTAIGDNTTKVRNKITLAGIVYEKGLGVNSPSTIVFNLGGKCTNFSATAGIDSTMDASGKTPNVIFNVLGDGTSIYTSGAFTGTTGAAPQAPVKISVDVTGVQLLTLNVDPNGVNWFDRANWADAQVTCGGDQPAPAAPGNGTTQLSHLPILAADFDPAFGLVARDTEIGDAATRVRRPLMLNNVTYATGLGVQAPTTLEFNVGGRCSVFQSLAGIDGTMDQAGKTPSVTFIVLGDGVQLYTSGEFSGGEPKSINVPIKGVKKLTLKVTEGTVNYFDRANWANARVTCADPETAPVTTATLPAASASGWHTVAPSLTLTTEPAKVLRSEYKLGAGAWTVYTAPIALPEGAASVSYRSVALGGTEETAKTLGTVKVDTIRPTVASSVSQRMVTLTGADAGSGVASIESSADGGATWRSYSAPIAAGDVALTLTYRSRDVAGNTSAPVTPLVIDAVPTPSAAPSATASGLASASATPSSTGSATASASATSTAGSSTPGATPSNSTSPTATAATSELSHTGAGSTPLLIMGMVVLLLGTVLTLARRRAQHG